MIIPCIDVQDGQAVQLIGGKERALDLGAPLDLLPQFAPFEWLHAIDLDAAMGTGENEALLEPILRVRKCRVGGGIRSAAGAQGWLNRGAAQVILGTAVFTQDGLNLPLLDELQAKIGRDRICIALDTRDRRIQIKGWQASLDLNPETVLQSLQPYASTVLCTVVDREGLMAGTDLNWIRRLRQAWDGTLVAAGGISTLEEVDALLAQGIQVALGMALYTGKLPLNELDRRERASKILKPEVWASHPYSFGPKPALGEGWIDLSGNESPFPPSPEIAHAIATAAQELNRYPDPSSSLLRKVWGDQIGVSANQMVIGNGSDELIHLLGLACLRPGDNIVVGDPTFSRYEAAAILNGAETRRVPLTLDFRHDLVAMASQVDERTKLIFLANPHNPTGTVLLEDEIRALLTALPETTILVLDEAYIDFVSPDVPIALASELIAEGHQVIGLRTLSKAHGLAGLRIGAAFGPEWMMEALDRIREPFSVNGLAQAAGIAALQNQDCLQSTVAECRTMATTMSEEGRTAGFDVAASHAFFAYIDCGNRATEVLDKLTQQKIKVRTGATWGKPSALRIGVPHPNDFSTVINRLKEAFSTNP